MIKIQDNLAIDQHSVSEVLRGIEAELGARAARRGNELGALVMGGGQLTETGIRDLARFACAKNWNILHVAMNLARPHDTLAASDLKFSYFATDGETEVAVVLDGAIWKRDHRTLAKLIFGAGHPLKIQAKADGSFLARKTSKRYHDAGFDIASQSIQARISQSNPSTGVLTSIGDALVIYDSRTMLRLLTGE